MDPASGSPSPSRFDGFYTIDKKGKWQKITDPAKMVEVEPILKCVENTLNNSSKTDCEECKGYLEALKTRVKKHLETKWWTAIPFLGKYLLSWAQKKVDNQFTPIQAAIQQKLLAPDLPVNVARIKVEQSVTTTTEMRKPFYGSANEYVTSLFRQGLEKGFDSKERYGVFDEFPQDAKPKAHEDESKTLFLSTKRRKVHSLIRRW
jgi:hypothetical protein